MFTSQRLKGDTIPDEEKERDQSSQDMSSDKSSTDYVSGWMDSTTAHGSESVRMRNAAREERKRRTSEKIQQIKEKLKKNDDRSHIKRCLLHYGLISLGAIIVFGTGFCIYKYFSNPIYPTPLTSID